MPKINKKGFTLIELLVVVVIITILTLFLAVSYTTVQRNSRDNQRRSDMQTVAGVLERFYSDNSHYPSSSNGQIAYEADCTVGTTVVEAWGTDNVDCNGKNYIKQLPQDPTRAGAVAGQYCYVMTNSNQGYELYADVEGTGNITSTTVSGCSGNYDLKVTSND